MGYTYDVKHNSIIVCPYTGIQIKRLYDLAKQKKGESNNYSNYKWTDGYLIMLDLGKMKKYEIYISEGTPDHPFLIKVKKKYHCANFESVFKLGSHCMNWSPDTIIGLTKIQHEQMGNI